MNVWIDKITGEYCIRYEGVTYRRKSYVAAKEVIDGFLCVMSLELRNDRLDKLYSGEISASAMVN